MDRRAELHGWIAETRRLQRRMTVFFAVLALVAAVVWLWNHRVGGLALLFIALVAVISFWVTGSHNAAHRGKLDELDRIGL